jgi:uncharacterized RDD family membrane protein YckC
MTEPAPPIQAGGALNALICPRCHERNEPTSTYCYSCGLPLDGANQRSGDVNPLPAFAMGRPGGFWVRFLAYIIDGVLLTALFLIVWPIISGESIADYWAASEGLGRGDLFSLSLNLVYYTVAVAIWATTIGKKPFGLYVVRTDGSRVGVGRALARYLAYVPSAIILGGGFLMIAFRQDKRGLHDLLCDTVVIRR